MNRIFKNTTVVFVVTIISLTGFAQTGDKIYSEAKKAHENGNYTQAIDLFTKAAEYMPDNPAIYLLRANCHDHLGNLDAVLKDYDTTIQKELELQSQKTDPDPTMAPLYYSRGYTHYKLGSYAKAILDYEKALVLDPNYPHIKGDLAWILATCPKAELRNPQKAIELATEACEQQKWREGNSIDTLAAAYATSGDFEKAVQLQEKAIEIKKNLVEKEGFKNRLMLYRLKKPYIEEPEKR